MATPNYKMDDLYDSVGMKRMKDSYMKPGENSPQDRLVNVCNFFGSNSDHSKRLYAYASKHWVSFSTPILSFDPSSRHALPISCYLCYIDDTVEGLIGTLSETNFMSVSGGGVSVMVDLRGPGPKSTGAIPHIKTYDSCVMAYKQGTRRGSTAVYMNIDHPEIFQFIDIRRPTGDYNMRCLNVHNAVNISDKFMQIIENCQGNPDFDDSWPLIDVKTKKITEVVSARRLWERILENRMETGEPYIAFIDACNRSMNEYQKNKGMTIKQSNLCTEVIVPTDSTRSSLCCLASLNIEKFDEWQNEANEIVGDVLEMLDNVLSVFENRSRNKINMKKVMRSATEERNVGLGVLGFQAYLQKMGLSMDSTEASEFNIELFKNIKKFCDHHNKRLGSERGTPKDIEGSGNRFSYTMAIAPTATTSIIMGNTSPSIEPYRANVYRQDTVSGSQFNKNKFLEKLFIEKGFGENLRRKIWTSVTMNRGSVAHLPSGILTDSEKNIFKTFHEIDQRILVDLAADRQKFIDQGQSLSLTFDPDEKISTVHEVHMRAWKKGLKTLYYCRSFKISNADALAGEDPFSSCVSCQ